MKKYLLWFAVVAGLITGAELNAGELVWPPSPDPAKVRYVTTITGLLEDTSVRLSPMKKLLRTLLGVSKSEEGKNRAFLRPTGLWVQGSAVYVADPGIRRVVKFDIQTQKITYIPSSRKTQLVFPVSVAVTGDGRIFVSDSGLNKVFIFDRNGRFQGELKSKTGALTRPTGLALDESRSRLYVADTPVHNIHVYDLQGKHLFSFGSHGAGQGQFNYPTYLWADTHSGMLHVCDSGNFRVQLFDVNGKFQGNFGHNGDRPGYMARPRGVSTDSDGNVYIADGVIETVQIFSVKGQLLLYFGENGSEPGFFSMPGGVFIDDKDKIYVADTYNSRIQIFQYLK